MAFFTSYKSRDTREADGREVAKGLNSSDPNERRLASETLARIRNEPNKVRDMREALVKAHRNGNQSEIKDIHDYVSKHSEYK